MDLSILIIWLLRWLLIIILVPYIRYREKIRNIASKWSFYSLKFLILVIAIVGIWVIVPFFMN